VLLREATDLSAMRMVQSCHVAVAVKGRRAMSFTRRDVVKRRKRQIWGRETLLALFQVVSYLLLESRSTTVETHSQPLWAIIHEARGSGKCQVLGSTGKWEFQP
jgi:hypothetical protein